MAELEQLLLFGEKKPDHALLAAEGEAGVEQSMFDPPRELKLWLESQERPFRRKTILVYTALWSRFCKYLDDNRMSLKDVQSSEIMHFLASREGVKRNQRERYQNLLERVFQAFLVRHESHDHYDPARNPAGMTNVMVRKGVAWRDAPANAPMQFLGTEMRSLLEAALIEKRHSLYSAPPRTLSEWRVMRDTAMCSFLLATGGKVAEVGALSVNCITGEEPFTAIDFSKYFGVSGGGGGEQALDPLSDATHAFRGEDVGVRRVVPMPSWASNILRDWLRVGHGSEGDPARTRLFPAARSATSARPSLVLNPATINRVVVNWGQRFAAGMSLTPQRLRNTCGANWLEEGVSMEEVERRMGYSSGAAAGFRLQQAWDAWQIAHPKSPNPSPRESFTGETG